MKLPLRQAKYRKHLSGSFYLKPQANRAQRARSQDYDIYPNCLSLEEHKYFE